VVIDRYSGFFDVLSYKHEKTGQAESNKKSLVCDIFSRIISFFQEKFSCFSSCLTKKQIEVVHPQYHAADVLAAKEVHHLKSLSVEPGVTKNSVQATNPITPAPPSAGSSTEDPPPNIPLSKESLTFDDPSLLVPDAVKNSTQDTNSSDPASLNHLNHLAVKELEQNVESPDAALLQEPPPGTKSSLVDQAATENLVQESNIGDSEQSTAAPLTAGALSLPIVLPATTLPKESLTPDAPSLPGHDVTENSVFETIKDNESCLSVHDDAEDSDQESKSADPTTAPSLDYSNGVVSYVRSSAYYTTCAVCRGVSFLFRPLTSIRPLVSDAISFTSNVLSVAYDAADEMASVIHPDISPTDSPESEDDESDKSERSVSETLTRSTTPLVEKNQDESVVLAFDTIKEASLISLLETPSTVPGKLEDLAFPALAYERRDEVVQPPDQEPLAMTNEANDIPAELVRESESILRGLQAREKSRADFLAEFQERERDLLITTQKEIDDLFKKNSQDLFKKFGVSNLYGYLQKACLDYCSAMIKLSGKIKESLDSLSSAETEKYGKMIKAASVELAVRYSDYRWSREVIGAAQKNLKDAVNDNAGYALGWLINKIIDRSHSEEVRAGIIALQNIVDGVDLIIPSLNTSAIYFQDFVKKAEKGSKKPDQRCVGVYNYMVPKYFGAAVLGDVKEEKKK